MTTVMAETTPWNWVTGTAAFKHRTARPRTFHSPAAAGASRFRWLSVVPAPGLALVSIWAGI